MSEFVIAVSELRRRFGARIALASVTLSLPRGNVYGLVGANGAGKKTLIKHILGLLRAQEGSVGREMGRSKSVRVEADRINIRRQRHAPRVHRLRRWFDGDALQCQRSRSSVVRRRALSGMVRRSRQQPYRCDPRDVDVFSRAPIAGDERATPMNRGCLPPSRGGRCTSACRAA
ncbi:MAG: type transport system ATP-binding protein [Thermoanaerobaculia bacterium]|nr:type transport system ATP-binding protein [Thermoanaerobaculia bacterium]